MTTEISQKGLINMRFIATEIAVCAQRIICARNAHASIKSDVSAEYAEITEELTITEIERMATNIIHMLGLCVIKETDQ